MNRQNLIVFTDMDGSLLDHYTYSHTEADALLAQLENIGVPVIPNTSKTRAELEQLRTELANPHPFIAENGAAVFLPKQIFKQQPPGTESDSHYWVKAFSAPRSCWQALIAKQSTGMEHAFVTFEQAGVSGIIEMTGLDKDKAALAGSREYGEPLKWLGTDEEAALFFSALKQQGAQILRGGRFSHVSGKCDKGTALNWLSEQYAQLFGSAPISIAIGDSQNDIAMLEAADYAAVIKSPVDPASKLHVKKDAASQLVYSTEYGPKGWAETVTSILRTLDIHMT